MYIIFLTEDITLMSLLLADHTEQSNGKCTRAKQI